MDRPHRHRGSYPEWLTPSFISFFYALMTLFASMDANLHIVNTSVFMLGLSFFTIGYMLWRVFE